MELQTWILTILAISTIHGICTFKLYTKANRKAWEAFVPVYNGVTLMEIINRPKWWVFLLFIPVINLLLLPVIWIETLRSFGRKSTTEMVLGVATLGLYIGYVNYTQEVVYEPKRDLTPATKALDTLGSLSFALIVATLVHTYLIQPFVIPTSSLEQTLLKGDFLFVSKFHYGARVHKTPIAAPMVHDTIPLLNVKSYIAPPELPYLRLPGISKIQRNDIVCFNWPADTLFNMYKDTDVSYYKPIDKKTNYVKRCTAIPGDVLEVKNAVLYINGKPSILPERAKVQNLYTAYSKTGVSTELVKSCGARDFSRIYNLIIENEDQKNAFTQVYDQRFYQVNGDNTVTLQTDADGINLNLVQKARLNISEISLLQREVNLTNEGFEALKKTQGIDSVVQTIKKPEGINSSIFPYNKPWTQDNLGPIKIQQIILLCIKK
jgi:signal peptidase I